MIGDVSGQGCAGGAVHGQAGKRPEDAGLYGKGPGDALGQLNDLLVERSRRGMFATLLYLELDSVSNRLTMANAGHLPPIIKKGDGTVKKTGHAGGSPLGILPGMQFGQECLQLDPGDTVVLYTDGIIEAMNAKEELYGYERFEELMRKTAPEPDALKAAIISDVNRFTGLSAQHDDMTLVCFGS